MIISTSETNLSQRAINKRFSYEKIYFFIMMIYMGMANGYTQVLCYPPSEGLWTSFVPIILTAILLFRNIKTFKNNKNIYKVLLAVVIWIALEVLKYSTFEPMNLFLLYNVSMAYIIAKLYGKYAMKLYDTDLTILCVISLIVWLIYNAAPNATAILFKTFFVESSGTSIANAFVVGLANSSDVLGLRNQGFGQEPGYFASFIIIGMFFNLIVHNFKVRNKNFLIQLVTLVTTQSTTGYVAFGVIVLLIILNGTKSRFVVIAATIILLPTILALPFITEKITKYQSNNDTINDVITTGDYVEQHGSVTYVPQRMDGFVLEWMNFTHDPLLGYGVKGEKTSYVNTNLSSVISCSNGNIKVFSRFGIIMGILFFIILFKSGIYLCGGSKKNGFVFLLMYLTISMSYEISYIPLLLSFWFMLPFFTGHFKNSSITRLYANKKK